ncbi:MAG: YihY/virulence factor BrkB family protein [Candidatus Limnocylindria bacterium]
MKPIARAVAAVNALLDDHRSTRVAKRAVARFLEHDDLQYAGSMAYFALLSIFQLLVLGVVVLSFFVDHGQARQFVIEQVTRGTPIDAGTVGAVIDGVVNSRGGISLFGIVFLLWGALGLFSAINKGVNRAWSGPGGPPPSFLRDKIVGLVLILFTGALAVASVAVGLALSAVQQVASRVLSDVPGGGILFAAVAFFVPFLFAFVALVVLYRFVPTPPLTFGQIWPGALVAAVIWEILRYGFVFFATRVAHYESAFGPISAGVVLLVFLYFASVVLLLGAEIAEAYSVESGKSREPAAAAVVVGPSVPIDAAGTATAPPATGSTASLTADAPPPERESARGRSGIGRWLPLAGVGAIGVLIGRWMNRDRDE